MINVCDAARAHFEDDSLNMFDPQSFYDNTKSVRTIIEYLRRLEGHEIMLPHHKDQ